MKQNAEQWSADIKQVKGMFSRGKTEKQVLTADHINLSRAQWKRRIKQQFVNPILNPENLLPNVPHIKLTQPRQFSFIPFFFFFGAFAENCFTLQPAPNWIMRRGFSEG